MLSKKALEKLNIFSNEDLLHHYPFRYEDLTHVIKGKVVSSRNLYTRFGKTIQKIIVQTKTGNQELTYFNQPYLIKTLRPGTPVSLAGNEYEINGPLIHTGRLVPIYPETKGISSKWLRRLIYNLLQTTVIEDWLPEKIKHQYHLLDLDPALRTIHFPNQLQEVSQAQKRLAFNEMFLLQLEALARKKQWQKKRLSHKIQVDQEKILALISSLPFKLTPAQNLALKEILADLSLSKPMNRLLQGEVGSGKTVVAAITMYAVYLNGFKSCLMAPTEILAQQHFQTLKTVFAHTPVQVGLITASTKTEGDILVGTHALLFKKMESKKIGLVVIDEQHRFGVHQRSQLVLKSPLTPHLLTMTATPIPRTIALTLYSDLDLSFLDELPEGRKPVKTWVVPPVKRLDAYQWIESQLNQFKTQAFIVCPLIEPSEKESMKDIKAVTQEFKQLKSVFNNLKLGLIHGRLKAKEKNSIISKFQKNKLNVLVATPVIEVGLDIPNASIMVIENADRFGLAQLHQLRGRIGRGSQESYCLLFSQSRNPETIKRLKYLETKFSGIELAEFDLRLRGPGNLYGQEQHGFFQLKLASFTDTKLIKQTQEAALGLKTLPLLLKKQLKKRKIRLVALN